MKYTVTLLVLTVLLAGCIDQQANWQVEKQAKRLELEQRFQNVYGDQWEEKLLEYDIEREKALLAKPVIPPTPINVYQPIPARTKQAYQTSPPSSQSGSTYWQEQAAQQQYFENQRLKTQQMIDGSYYGTR